MSSSEQSDDFARSTLKLSPEQLSEIANEMVRIKAEHYGKGPVQARAYQNASVILCVMQGGLTTVERTLLEGGDEELVRAVRLRFQDQMTDTFESAIERITGAKVIAYSSQVVFDPDMIFEICVLEDGVTAAGE